MNDLSDLEAKVAAGGTLTSAEARRVVACPDLPAVGELGERARRARHGNRVTFVRVCEVRAGESPEPGNAGEVRLVGAPATPAEARERVREARRLAAGLPVTGYSLHAILDLVGGDRAALADFARSLKEDGLESVADVCLDEFDDASGVIESIGAVRRGGLEAWRATVTHAVFADRLPLIERAAAVQRETGALKAFAPLSCQDPVEQPSTGYDDVRTIALARLLCGAIASIQVDWSLYGPKLAQVAIAFGADDVDRVAPRDSGELGRRRSPREEIVRQIRMAAAEPVERDGRYVPRG